MKDKSGSSDKVKGKRSKDAADSEDQPDMKLIAEKTIDDEASFTDEEFDGNFSTEFDDSNDEQWKEENESWANSDDEEEELDLQTKYLAPSDSEEDDFDAPVNTIGNVPLEWYDDYPHIGYDLNGKRIMRPATRDELDSFLAKMDDPEHWNTFHDKVQHRDIKLTQEEIDIIKKLQGGQFPDSTIDPYAPSVDFFTQDVMQMPLTGAPEPKRRFIPSKWEHKKVMKIVRAIRAGHILPKKPKQSEVSSYLNIWDDSTDKERAPNVMHIPAPKMKLPDHSESYNPSEEYLPTEEEQKEWEGTDPEDRRRNYLPQKFENFRSVPGYSNFVQERFSRCLDLYLCPRQVKQRVIDPDSLLPELPDPKELEPFPKNHAITYRGHSGRVRCCSVDPSGQWMVSGSDDKSVKLWDVMTGRCLRSWTFDDTVNYVAWNPNKKISLFLVISDVTLYVINPLVGSPEIQKAADLLTDVTHDSEPNSEKTKGFKIKWAKVSQAQHDQGFRLILTHNYELNHVTWHRKGDYFATVANKGGSEAVQIHQLSKHRTQNPFSKSKGLVQQVLFHPNKPFLFVATQRYVRVYNLIRQELHKCLQPGAKWISSIAIHPQGDNIIVGTYDKKLCWFDMDLGAKPYKILRYHDFAIRGVSFHSRYPIFSSCSDDGSVHIFHGMVYNDLMKNPLIVPLKVIKAHEVTSGGLGGLHCEFHPTQPWVFSCGADKTIKLFS